VLWQPWGEAFPISEAETPDLAAYLLNDCELLIKMARILGKPEVIEELDGYRGRLSEALQQSWMKDRSIYQHKDRDLHTRSRGELLLVGNGAFKGEIKRTFEQPVRVVVMTECDEGDVHPINIVLRGKGRTKRSRTEKLTKSAFHWFWQVATTLVDRPFTQLESAEINRVPQDLRTEIRTPDLTRQDQTCFLPLLSGAMEPSMAARLIETHLLDERKFWRRNGIPNTSAQDPAYSDSTRHPTNQVHFFWNSLIAEGLLYYGYKAEAAELLQKLINAVGENLRQRKAFRSVYHADRAESSGELDHAAGIAPVGLFLEMLDLRLISADKVVLNPKNPFPWPVRLNWKNLEIRWEGNGALVRFAEGVEILVEGDEPVIVQRGEDLE
jgi:hypothetical protein